MKFDTENFEGAGKKALKIFIALQKKIEIKVDLTISQVFCVCNKQLAVYEA